MTLSRIFVALLLLAAGARSNVGFFGGAGQDVLLASTADVQLVSEDVTIDVDLMVARFSCRFQLRNLSDRPVELQAGFPLTHEYFGQYPHQSPRPLVDGREACEGDEVDVVARTFRFIARDADSTYHVRYLRHDAAATYGHLFLWTMAFAARQVRVLTVTYELPASMFGAFPLNKRVAEQASSSGLDYHTLVAERSAEAAWMAYGYALYFTYVTETGASWAGEIERADFHVRTWRAAELMPRYASHALSITPDPATTFCEPTRLVWFELQPDGWVVPKRQNPLSDEPVPEAHAYDWHFEPFSPGAQFFVGWIATPIPASAQGVRDLLAAHDPMSVEQLQLLRAAIAAWHGVEPTEADIRSILSEQIWYSPVSGRTENELTDAVKQQLALIDAELAARASPPIPR
jgi:hypothetical protein